MKTPIVVALAAVALSALTVTAVPTFAQAGPGQGKAHRGAGLKKLGDALGLSDAQKAQIKTIMQSAQQQAKAIKADTSLTPEAKKAKMQELGKSARQQSLAVLTPEQREKLKALRQQRGQRLILFHT